MKRLLLLLAVISLGGCYTTSVRTVPKEGSLIPDHTLKVSPTYSFALEKLVYWGALAGVAYMVLDPQAPNWEIEEAPLGDRHIHFSLRMKRYYAGGAGEAQALFHRRAKELMRLNGYDDYKVVEYQESLESSVLGSQRTATGVIVLSHKPAG